MCCHQYLFFDGVFKLNDFENAIIRRHDRDDPAQTCPDPFAMSIFKMRAPEEMRIEGRREGWWTGEAPDSLHTDKVDVYLMANVLYTVLTNRYVFEDEDKRVAHELVARGRRPSLLGAQNSPEPALRAVVRAIRMAWEDDPPRRPSAREVTDFLDGELRKLDEVYRDTGVCKVTLPAHKELMSDGEWWEKNRR